jgi:hypothetical protein
MSDEAPTREQQMKNWISSVGKQMGSMISPKGWNCTWVAAADKKKRKRSRCK